MKKMLVAVLMAVVVMFAGSSLASAQSNAALAKVPFKFIAGGKLLPAGSYRITVQPDDPTMLLITSDDHKSAAAFAVTEWAGGPDSAPGVKVHLTFKNFNGQYFLSQVAMPGQDTRLIPLTKGAAEQVLVRLNLMPAERADVAK